jgi:hypothetical protein
LTVEGDLGKFWEMFEEEFRNRNKKARDTIVMHSILLEQGTGGKGD